MPRVPLFICRMGVLPRWLLMLFFIFSATLLNAAQPDSRRAVAVEPVELTGKRWALLIGIDEYESLRDLKYCGADVVALGNRLKTAGFASGHVTIMHDDSDNRALQPDRSKILAQLEAILKKVHKGDLLLLAFSGHGVRVNGESYICPYEAQTDGSTIAVDTLISLKWIYEQLKKSPASVKLLLVDACQNQLLPGTDKAVQTKKSVEDFAKSLSTPPQGILLLTSCAPGEYSRESAELKHGVYMHFLLNGLEGSGDSNNDGIISLKELDAFATHSTQEYVSRTFIGHTQTPSLKGELRGDIPLAQRLKLKHISVPADIDSLEHAIRLADVDATISISKGHYMISEPLHLSQTVSLIGKGKDPSEVLITSKSAPALLLTGGKPRIQNLAIELNGAPVGDEDSATRAYVISILDCAPDIVSCVIPASNKGGIGIFGKHATARLDSCAIQRTTQDGITIGREASPTLNRCEVRDSGGRGVWITGNSSPSLNKCIIAASKYDNLFVSESSFPTVRECSLRDGHLKGISLYGKSSGKYIKCDIYNHQRCGLVIKDSSRGTFTECVIHGNTCGELFSVEDGGGSISISNGGDPRFVDCSVYNNRHGILCFLGGKGTFSNCKVFGNKTDNILVSKTQGYLRDHIVPGENTKSGVLSISGSSIYGSAQDGIEISEGGRLSLSDSKIFNNAGNGILIDRGGNGTIDTCAIYDNKFMGVNLFHERSKGEVDDCRIYSNVMGNMNITEKASASIKRCDIQKSVFGVAFHKGGSGEVIDSRIHEHRSIEVLIQDENSKAKLSKCEVYESQGTGVFANMHANVEVSECTVHFCAKCGVFGKESAHIDMFQSKASQNKEFGVGFVNNASGRVLKCDLRNNQYEGVAIHESAGSVYQAKNSE